MDMDMDWWVKGDVDLSVKNWSYYYTANKCHSHMFSCRNDRLPWDAIRKKSTSCLGLPFPKDSTYPNRGCSSSFFALRQNRSIGGMWGCGVCNLPQWLPGPSDPPIRRFAIYGQSTARWCAAWSINRHPKCECEERRTVIEFLQLEMVNWQIAATINESPADPPSCESLAQTDLFGFARLRERWKLSRTAKQGLKGEPGGWGAAGGAAGDQIHVQKRGSQKCNWIIEDSMIWYDIWFPRMWTQENLKRKS